MQRFTGFLNKSLLWAFLSLLVWSMESPAWEKFTTEELDMTAPDWCHDADLLALDRTADYNFQIYSSGFKLEGEHHVRLKVLTARGQENSDFTIVEPFGVKIRDIQARTITPDGRTVKVKSNQVFKSTIFTGPDHNIRQRVYRVAFSDVAVGALLEIQYKSYSEQVVYVPPHFFDVDGVPTLRSNLSFGIPQGIVYYATPVNFEYYAAKTSNETETTLAGEVLRYIVTIEKSTRP